MPHIKILPEILSNKIAAGEVVERPASVVKELVENALDAGSTIIIIEVEKGGRSLIRVSDNGTGMNHDDALLAIERYATSKIFTDQDLFSISTLGFRGEALPSIASVSKFSLITRDESSEAGTEVYVEGGRIKKVRQAGSPKGSMISAEQLFYNTPARRKFLKTINTEMGHIADTVAAMALSRPDVQFTLCHNSRTVKSWSQASDQVDRAADVLGREVRDNLYRINYKEGNITIDGHIASPRITRSTFRGIYIFVNNRFVKDRVIRHALFEGYAQRLMKGTFPVAVLFINVPFDQVDVNVHPTKHEVRFVRQRQIHDLVQRAVAETLHLSDRPKWSTRKFPESISAQDQSQVAEVSADYKSIRKGALRFDEQRATSIEHRVSSIEHPVTSNEHPATQTPIWSKKLFADLRIIGQLHNTYILCESEDSLFLIDQHAAHERILFEKFKNRSKGTKQPSQRLLIPETVDIGYAEADTLNRLIPDLEDFGLEIEHFGGNTFVVKSVPDILSGREIKPLIVEIAEKMTQTGFAPNLEKAIDECLILMACHSAIRANQVLSDAQIKGLLNQLDECENPSHCPHGRPTWIKRTIKDLEKSFGRIV